VAARRSLREASLGCRAGAGCQLGYPDKIVYSIFMKRGA
jgi:hypothetical protein